MEIPFVNSEINQVLMYTYKGDEYSKKSSIYKKVLRSLLIKPVSQGSGCTDLQIDAMLNHQKEINIILDKLREALKEEM